MGQVQLNEEMSYGDMKKDVERLKTSQRDKLLKQYPLTPQESFKITIKQVVDRLCEELKNDQAYYYAWQANIAMAFKDEFQRQWDKDWNEDLNRNTHRIIPVPKNIHEIANKAAKDFLDLLIKTK